jgi:hypothetical protein
MLLAQKAKRDKAASMSLLANFEPKEFVFFDCCDDRR